MMTQMEDVQQKQQEVLQQEKRQFEKHQKEMFEKQLSEVKEELEPYKDKCLTLEKENKDLMDKYEQDLFELKTKLDEVEQRYHANELEEENIKVLKQELELYRKKVSQLESGNKLLVENYEAQIANMKRNLEEVEEGDLKVLKEEVKIYQNKVGKLQEEKTLLKENCDNYKLKIETSDRENNIKDEKHKKEKDESEKLVCDLRREIADLAEERDRNEQENSRIVSESEKIKSALVDLEHMHASCKENEEKEKKNVADLVQETEASKHKCLCLESENKELKNKLLVLQQQLNSYEDERSGLQEKTVHLTNELQVVNGKHELLLSVKVELESTVAKLRVQLDENNKSHRKLKKDFQDLINEIDGERDLNRRYVDEKERLSKEIEFLQSKLENENAEYKAVVDEKNDLAKSINILKEEMIALREGKDKAISEIGILQQRLNTLSEELGNKKEGNNNTMREIENLNASLNGMMSSLENSEKEQERVKSENEDMTKTVMTLREEVKTKKEEIQNLTVKNEQLQKQLSGAVSDLKASKNKLAQLQEKKKKSDNKLGAQIQRLMMTVKNLEGDIRSHEKRCQQLEDERKRLVSNHEMEVSEFMEKIERLETSQEKLHKSEEEKNNIEREMAEIKSDLTFYQTKLSEVEEVGKTLSETNKEEKESLHEKIRQLDEILERREKELKMSRNKLKEVRIEKEATDRAHAEEMTALKIVLKAFEGSVEDEFYRVSNEKYSLEIENAGLKKELSLTKYSLDELQMRNAEYEKEIATLVSDVERLKTLVEKSQGGMNESFVEEKQILHQEIENLRKDLEHHKTHVIELEEEGNHSFGVLLSQHEKELEALKEELEDQIAKKREQLAKDAAAKRQKIREEYESKVRVLYDELVAEKGRMKSLQKLNEQLTVEINKFEENKKTETRVKLELEENLKSLEGKLKKNEELKIVSLTKQQEYEDSIANLEKKVKELQSFIQNEKQENYKENQKRLDHCKDSIDALQTDVSNENGEEVILLARVQKLEETRDHFEDAGLLQKEIEELKRRLEEGQCDYNKTINLLEREKDQFEKELQNERELKQRHQKEMKERDAERQAVVEEYDLRIEELTQELEAANGRTVEVQKKLEVIEVTFSTKQNEWKAELDQLITEKENLLIEHERKIETIKKSLEAERTEVKNLQQKIRQLELQLSEKLEEIRFQDKRKDSFVDMEERIKLLKDQLINEENEATKLRLVIDSNDKETAEDRIKLKQLEQCVEEKDEVVKTFEKEIRHMEEKLMDEVTKSTKRDEELNLLLKTKSADYVSSLERVKEDLKQEYEESIMQLKKNYESIFARMEEEQKVKIKEMETEIETLKGMVDNLEQLNQLKDEEHEVLMKEQAENFVNEIDQLHCTSLENRIEMEKLEKDKEVLSSKVKILEKQIFEVTKEKDVIAADHENTLLELKSKMSSECEKKINELTQQIKFVEDEKQGLKNDYEKEIDSLQKQLSFENFCQLNLQTEHEKELSEQKELLEKQHKLDVEKYNCELQEKTRQLDSVREEYQKQVQVLTGNIEKRNREFETLTEEFTSKNENEIARLQNELEAKCQELDRREAEHKNQVQVLTQKIQNISQEHPSQETTELKKMRNGYDVLVSSLRAQNQALGDQNDKLKQELEETLTAHQENVEEFKADLERQYKYQQDKLSKKHAGELDSLMEKLEALVRQENASKTMTEEHMKGIELLREEFDKKLERLTSEKRREMESVQARLEQQYKSAITVLNEQLVAKEAEKNRCKDEIKDLKTQVESLEKVSQNNLANRNDIMRLRQENTELYIKLREEISRNRVSPEIDKSKRQVDQLKEEIAHLKLANKNLQNALEQSTLIGDSEVESVSSDRNRLLQLIQLMEQLMMEKNALELKLREEIIDLKTRFGIQIDSSYISPFSSSEKSLTRDGLVGLLQECRENKLKQEEDIKAHVVEIESMIEDAKNKLDSTAHADRKIQEILESQVKHLEEQRRLMVDRLWQLGDKHRSLEEKITRQIEGQSNKSSPGSHARTRYYENVFEESLRREKEMLSLKRKQVEDLQTRLAVEKTALAKHVADKRKVQRQILEKDKLETALSSERNELERKWIGSLKAKELELRHEKAYLESKREDLNGFLGDTRYKLDSTNSRFIEPQNAQKLESNLAPNWKISVRDTPLNTDKLNFRYISVDPPEAKNPSIVDYGKLRRRISDETNTDSWSSPVNLGKNQPFFNKTPLNNPILSSNSRFSVKVDEELNEIHIPRLSLDTEEESDSELDVSEGLSLDIDSDDSDAELYRAHSVELLDDLDLNWEKNLEEDLKRISAGEIITNSEPPTAKQSQAGTARKYLTRSQSDSLIKVKSTGEDHYALTITRTIQDDSFTSKPSSFDFAVDNEQYPPRTSTAVGHHTPNRSPFLVNGLENLSHIPTVLPNIFRDLKLKGSSLNTKKPSKTKSYRAADNSNAHTFSRKITEGSVFGAPLSSVKDGTCRDLPGFKGQDGPRTLSPSLFMINIEDYVDRHQVQFSDDVASLREPSLSEKRHSS